MGFTSAAKPKVLFGIFEHACEHNLNEMRGGFECFLAPEWLVINSHKSQKLTEGKSVKMVFTCCEVCSKMGAIVCSYGFLTLSPSDVDVLKTKKTHGIAPF